MATEKRLIDADERLEVIRDTHCQGCNNYGGVKCRACQWDDAMGIIEDAPTVDAVEVVRCKECANTCPGHDGLVCTIWGAGTDPDGWCYRGEQS